MMFSVKLNSQGQIYQVLYISLYTEFKVQSYLVFIKFRLQCHEVHLYVKFKCQGHFVSVCEGECNTAQYLAVKVWLLGEAQGNFCE